ncbi:MAG: PLP-dependent aminotransferase family protein [Bradymonadales bacterium]|nr:PLP-dependent aminotransferase family protein [Bradymonadales bacterium]
MEKPLFHLTQRARRRKPSAIRELMPYMEIDGMITLGGGYPSPSTFAFDHLRLGLRGSGREILISGQEMIRASQYGPTPGLAPVLEQIRDWHRAKDGIEPAEGGLLVLNGSQEGIYILADLFLEEGDEVVLSEPTYPGALIAFSSFTDRFLTVPMDDQGMRVDLLEDLLEQRKAAGEPLPKLIYDIPNGHNPAGVNLAESRRQKLAELAVRHRIPVIEDDPYQLLRLDDSPREPTLQRLAPELVFRLDSFSKILCPGLRLGYVTAPDEIIRAMALYKQAANLQTSSLAQAILNGYFKTEGHTGLMQRVAENVRFYRTNRDAMVQAAHQYLPQEVRFAVPQAGMFIWFELPEGCDSSRMIAQDCAELKVLLVPGSAFAVHSDLRGAMRASYAMVNAEQIELGVLRFSRMIENELARAASR